MGSIIYGIKEARNKAKGRKTGGQAKKRASKKKK